MLNISQKAKNTLLAPSRYIKFKLEVYFDGEDNPPTDITHDVISFDTVEEVSPSTTLPFGGVSYNELSVVLDNMSKIYTISNEASVYNGKLIANKKVRLTYQVEVEEDVFEDIPGGVFYTDAWSSDNEALTATLTCYDKMALYGDLPVKRFRVLRGITFKEAFSKLFHNAGINSNDYIIDGNLTGTLDYFWCTGDTLNKCLDDLSVMAIANVFVTKSNKIYVVSSSSYNNSDILFSDANLILTSKTSPSYDNVYSGVLLNYNYVNQLSSSTICTIEGVVLPTGSTVLKDIPFSTDTVVQIDSIVLNADSSVYIEMYEYTDKYISITLINNNAASANVDITINGSVLSYSVASLYNSNNSITNNILNVSLPFACSKSYATSYASSVLAMYSNLVSTVNIDMRGYPPIELFDVVDLDSPTSSVSEKFYVKKISNSFDTGLTSTIELRVE